MPPDIAAIIFHATLLLRRRRRLLYFHITPCFQTEHFLQSFHLIASY
jgi:hypothetical protein